MNEHEEKFVDAFVVKEKRERTRLLLRKEKRRREYLDRLNHHPDLDARFASSVHSHADVAALLRKCGSPELVYLIADARELDGKTLPLEQAIAEVEFHGWGAVVSCIPGRLAYYCGEAGTQRRFILERKESQS